MGGGGREGGRRTSQIGSKHTADTHRHRHTKTNERWGVAAARYDSKRDAERGERALTPHIHTRTATQRARRRRGARRREGGTPTHTHVHQSTARQLRGRRGREKEARGEGMRREPVVVARKRKGVLTERRRARGKKTNARGQLCHQQVCCRTQRYIVPRCRTCDDEGGGGKRRRRKGGRKSKAQREDTYFT